MVKNPNSTRVFIQRNLRGARMTPRPYKYKSLMRPVVNYNSVVRGLHTQTNISKIEIFQRRTVRFCKTSSVSRVINDLQWQTLHERRKQAKCNTMYRIVNHQVVIRASPLLPTLKVLEHMAGYIYHSPEHWPINIPSSATAFVSGTLFPRKLQTYQI